MYLANFSSRASDSLSSPLFISLGGCKAPKDGADQGRHLHEADVPIVRDGVFVLGAHC